jgi:hypothetical protein
LLGLADIVIVGIAIGFTVIMTGVLVTVVGLAQGALLVMVQVIASPVIKVLSV